MISARLVGMSIGGWFCLRAAAFEPRLKRVIASGHAVDHMKSMNIVLRKIHLWCMEHFRAWMEQMAEKKFRGEGQGPWVVDHLKYIKKRDRALDALDFYLDSEHSAANLLKFCAVDWRFLGLRSRGREVRQPCLPETFDVLIAQLRQLRSSAGIHADSQLASLEKLDFFKPVVEPREPEVRTFWFPFCIFSRVVLIASILWRFL